MTNFEKIKNMSVDEIANFLSAATDNCTIMCGNMYCSSSCRQSIKKRLEMEADKAWGITAIMVCCLIVGGNNDE